MTKRLDCPRRTFVSYEAPRTHIYCPATFLLPPLFSVIGFVDGPSLCISPLTNLHVPVRLGCSLSYHFHGRLLTCFLSRLYISMRVACFVRRRGVVVCRLVDLMGFSLFFTFFRGLTFLNPPHLLPSPLALPYPGWSSCLLYGRFSTTSAICAMLSLVSSSGCSSVSLRARARRPNCPSQGPAPLFYHKCLFLFSGTN